MDLLDRVVAADADEWEVSAGVLSSELSSLTKLPVSAVHRLDLGPVASAQFSILADGPEPRLLAYTRGRRCYFVEKYGSRGPSSRLASVLSPPRDLKRAFFIYDPAAGFAAAFRLPFRLSSVSYGVFRLWSPPLEGTCGLVYYPAFWVGPSCFVLRVSYPSIRKALSYAHRSHSRIEELWNLACDISNWSFTGSLGRLDAARYRGIRDFLEESFSLDLSTMFQPLAFRVIGEYLPERRRRALLSRDAAI